MDIYIYKIIENFNMRRIFFFSNECFFFRLGRYGSFEDCEDFVEIKINFVSRCILVKRVFLVFFFCFSRDCSLI